MKKIIVLATIALLCPAVQDIHAQNIEGQIIAAQFGEFEVPTVGTGFSFPPASCQIPAGGKNFSAFTAGVPIKIVDTNPSHTEVVTPIAAFVTNSTCSVSMTPTFQHTSFSLTSGTGGLQESINYGQTYGGANTIILNQQWYTLVTPRSAATVISTVAGNTALGLIDVTTTPYTAYSWNGTQYVATGGGGGGGTPTGAAGGGLAGTYPNPRVAGTLNVMSYGAACNWSTISGTGTDDTAAFNSASTAANAIYVATGSPVEVDFPQGCTLGTAGGNSTVTWQSGVYWKGGSIFVPAQTTNALFQMTSTDEDAWLGGSIIYMSNLSACGPTINNDLCIAMRYDSASPGTATTHHHVFIENAHIFNSGWGILIGPQAGTDNLDGILLTNNFIGQTGNGPITSYQYNDGIHVGGGVSSFVISNNIVTGRSDAGVAISSEFSTVPRLCHDGTITGNTLYEDRVGIDNSGCSNLTITGNHVNADIPVGNSNPAFRSIYYSGQLPKNVTVTGNWFHNDETVSGSDVTAKVDCFGGCGNGTGTVNLMNTTFNGNHLQTFYADGSQIDISGNYFEDNLGFGTGANQNSITVNWDTVNVNGSYYVTIGQNNWQYRGQISLAGRSDIYFADVLYPQNTTNGQLTILNQQSFGVPQNSTFYSYTVPQGGQYGWSNQTPGAPTAAVVACLLSGGAIGLETSPNCGSAVSNATAPVAVGNLYDNGLTLGNCAQAGASSSSPLTTSGFPCPTSAPLPSTYASFAGNTYFVDNVNGSDSNAGTSPALAWKTIAKVNGFSFGGTNQVLFLAGDVWHEQLTVPAANMTFGAYGPQRTCLLNSKLVAHCTNMPIIDGADVITPSSWSVQSGANYKAAYTSTASKGFADSLYRQQTPLALQTSIANVTATAGSIFSDGTNVYVHLLDGSNPANHVIEVSGSRSYGVNLGGNSSVTVDGLEIIRTAKSGIIAYNGAAPGSSNTVSNNVLFNIGDTLGDPAIGLGANAGEAGVYEQAYGAAVTGWQATGNWIGRLDFTPSTLSYSQAAIQFIESAGTVISGNSIATVNGQAIQTSDGFNATLGLCTSPTINSNTIVNSQGAVNIYGCSGAIITNNVTHDSFGNFLEIGGGYETGNQNNNAPYISGNTFWNLQPAYSNGLYNGIDVNHATNGIATGNSCHNVANDCMTLEADSNPSSGWQIYGNTFDATENTYFDGTACTSSNRCFTMYVRNTSLSGGLTMRANTMVGNAASTVLVRWGATSASDSTHDLTQAAFDSGYPNYEIGGPIGNFTQVNIGASAPTSCGSSTGCLAQAPHSAAGTALPTCNSSSVDSQMTVSDATSPTYMGAYTSGGGITAAVICSYNGSTYSWLTH